jgi:ferredoxin
VTCRKLATNPRGASPESGCHRISRVRVSVDEDVCAATGECERICPEVFTVDEVSRVLVAAPGPELHDLVLEAEAACPTSAISVVD